MGEKAKIILNEYSAKNLLYRDTLDLDKFYTADLRLICEVARKEIERLKEQNEIDVKLNLELLDKVGKLNNILKELEKWLKEEQVNSVYLDEWTIIQVRDKILELKGSE